ncbi:DNA-binding response OmpR family regulator [Inhella inkyongensis]|uniref:DNA-binding response OmpR family regulator n=1 Tax=Inhella inkyongensis TaxID=392593 RepID=A0A840S959_9BURK|nr:response regulator transcription factor [Inhella inkyongensis]MBB5206068.1 DNA-binding response OmpR family regulator [Inhella inkyongensis]
MKILLVEDDLDLGQGTSLALQHAGLDVSWVRNLSKAQAQMDAQTFAAIVLDLGLPDGDGLLWLHKLRSLGRTLPVLILSARDSLPDRLRGLDGGADDYLVKPFALDELLSRLRALLRRSGVFRADALACRGLTMDAEARQAELDGKPLTLSPTEFQLLHALLRRVGRVVTRAQLEALALANAEVSSLDMHMSNLRRKLGPGWLRTVRGIGYVIDLEPRTHDAAAD